MLVALICALLCPPVTSAQVPKSLQRCHSYPPFADEIEKLNQEVELKTTERARLKQVVVDSVTFDAPTGLPESVREKFVATLKQQEFDDDPKSAWVDEIAEVWVRGAWQDQGYFMVEETVKAKVVGGDATQQNVALTVHVNEGVQFFLGSLQFRSADPDKPLIFPKADLRKLIPLQDGDIFDADKVRQSLDSLRQLYGSEGYIDFTAEPDFDVDDARQRISLMLVLDQQNRFRISKVEVLGLDSTTESALRSEMKSGDVFDYGLLKQFLAENRAALPPDASLEDVSLEKHVRTGIVDMKFNFFTCPQAED
jgi:hypothetical protein